MLKLLRMEVEGFCSIPKLSLPFDQNQTILIKGYNGAGKSGIFSALVWGLYGKTLKGVSDVQTWKEIRPKDYRGAMISVYFQRKESVYQVIRCQNYQGVIFDGAKGKDRFLVIRDAELIDIKGKIQLQQKLVEILGLSQGLFTNSIMFGQGINRLIQESNTDKKKLFEEIFDLNYLNIAKGIAQEDKSNIISQLNEVESESVALKRELDSFISTYKDLKEREKTFSEHIRSERSELRQDKKKLLSKRAEIQDKLGESSTKAIQDVREEIEALRTKYNKAKNISRVPIREFIDKIYELLQGKQYKKASDSLMELKTAFGLMDETQKQIDISSDSLRKLEESEREYHKYKQALEDIDEDLDSIKSQLKKLKDEKLHVLSPKYKEKIEITRNKLRKIDEDYHNKELELKDYNWVIDDPLGNNGIKAYLFDSSLDMLNAELEKYSSILGFRISFEIDLSTTRKEFCTLIEREGHIIEYEELSGGEKQLVDISMAFAMNQALTVSKGINIAFLDEVFESLSSDNIELVIQLVKEVYQGKTLFLISHHDSLPFSNVKILEVEKHQGLSCYKGL